MSNPQQLAPITPQMREYVGVGWGLTIMPPRSKGPVKPGWNRKENALLRPEQIPANYLGNVGLLHEFSGTCAIDIDDLTLAVAIFKSHGISLMALIEAPDAVLILSGRVNRTKLIYRRPEHVTSLRTHKRLVEGVTVFELRCDGVQDVLPPSIHPDTDKPYQWKGDWRNLPTLPSELLVRWDELGGKTGNASIGSLPDATSDYRIDLRIVAPELPELVERLREAIAAIPSCISYDEWIRVIWAVRAHGFSVGESIAREWSATCADKFDEAAFNTAWRNDRGRGIGAGSLYYIATKYGWSQQEPQPLIIASNKQSGTLVVVDIGKLLASPFPPREMLLSPWLQSQSLVMIYAWRGVGKTHIALCIAYALASGGTFLGWSAPVPVRVLYIDGEMPGPALQERVTRIVASNEGKAEPGYLRFITPDLQPNGVMPNLATLEGQALVESVLGDAKVIVVDNLSCLARGGKENEAESWQPLADWALRMRAFGRSVIFIHHSGKGGAQRGTSKREDLLDAVLLLKRPGDYEAAQGARFEIHFEKARALFGQDVAPIEAKLETTPDGQQHWTTKTVEAIADAQMIELAQLGLSQAEIARELGCHRSTVLRTLGKAQAEGRYSPRSKALKSPKPTLRTGGDDPGK